MEIPGLDSTDPQNKFMDKIRRVHNGLAPTGPRHIFTIDNCEYDIELHNDIADDYHG